MRRIASSVLKKNFKSTFMSNARDTAMIWDKLLVSSKPYSDKLKRLLIINTHDCLDKSQEQYQDEINKYTIKDMFDKQYIRNVPKLETSDFDEVKSYVLLEFDDFVQSSNTEYRDCVISFTIISNLDYWQLDDYQLRPWMIAGYIDGILDDTELSGIGRINFVGAEQVVFNEYLGGVILRYAAFHSDADDSVKVDNRYPAPQQLAVIDNKT